MNPTIILGQIYHYLGTKNPGAYIEMGDYGVNMLTNECKGKYKANGVTKRFKVKLTTIQSQPLKFF